MSWPSFVAGLAIGLCIGLELVRRNLKDMIQRLAEANDLHAKVAGYFAGAPEEPGNGEKHGG